MLTAHDCKKVFEILASARRGCIIVVGTCDHGRPINGAALDTYGDTRRCPLPQTGPHIEKIFYRTEEGTRAVDSLQFNGNAIGEDRLLLFGPVSVEESLENRISKYPLTRREQEIALWVMRGLSNREIAEKLFICEQTVKDHLHDIFERMHVRRRSELTAKVLMPAVDDRILPPPRPA